MKPYNTRKARRGRFNVFPHTVPRWGWHHRRSKYYCNAHVTEQDDYYDVKRWSSPPDYDESIIVEDILLSSKDKNHTEITLSLYLLFVYTIAALATTGADNIVHCCHLVSALICAAVAATLGVSIIALVFNCFKYVVTQGCCYAKECIYLMRQAAFQGSFQAKEYIGRQLWKLTMPPQPNYLRLKYKTPMHKLLSVLWFSQILWVTAIYRGSDDGYSDEGYSDDGYSDGYAPTAEDFMFPEEDSSDAVEDYPEDFSTN